MPYADPERRRAYNRAYYTQHRDQLLVQQRAYWRANAARLNRRQREYAAQHQEQARAQRRRWKHGISADQFDALWDSQQGRCAACRCLLVNTKEGCHVDHDHRCCSAARSCGRCVRGLLCGPCNKGLGYFNDDTGRLHAAMEYLDKFPNEWWELGSQPRLWTS